MFGFLCLSLMAVLLSFWVWQQVLCDNLIATGNYSLRMINGNQEFLYYLMKYYMPQLLNKESGTVFGSVNKQDIENLEIEIPDNSEVQKRIARYLTMLDERIEINNAINNNLAA